MSNDIVPTRLVQTGHCHKNQIDPPQLVKISNYGRAEGMIFVAANQPYASGKLYKTGRTEREVKEMREDRKLWAYGVF